MKPIVLKLSLVFVLSLCIHSKLDALTITSQESINLDKSIEREDLSYSSPDQIVVAPIFVQDDAVKLNDTKRYRGIYYYLVQKLGFSDIPFHYVISESGQVFEGNTGGDERKVQIGGIGSNVILIGYMGSSLKSYFDPRSDKALTDLLIDVANRNSINPNNIVVSGLKFSRDDINKTVSMESQEVFGNWKTSMKDIVDKVEPAYSPVQKSYSAEVTEVTLPTESIAPGEEVIVSIKVKNTGTTGMYGGSNSEIIATKLDGNSSFYINNLWLSNSQTAVMTEEQNLLPGGEGIFDFKVKSPLYIGERVETFELKTLSGAKVSTNNFDIKLNIKKTDRQIVEIKNSVAGFFNVYADPFSSSTVLTKVSAGERYFLLEVNQQTLWSKIDLGNGRSGYIAAWNFTYIQ